MEYWLALLSITILLLFADYKSGNTTFKYICRISLIISVTYFSAFRDGLGSDYNQYIVRLSYVDLEHFSFDFFSEPSFWLLSYIINKSMLSEVFYFAFMSVCTIVPLLICFYKSPNPENSILLFLLFPGCGFMQSFNVIRQFCAAAIIMVGLFLLYKHKNRYFIILTLLAMLFHKSAILVLFVPLLLKLNFHNKKILLVLLLVSYFSQFINVDLSWIHLDDERYNEYFVINEGKQSTTIFVAITLILAYIITQSERFIETDFDEFVYKLSYCGVILYNFSSWNYSLSRVALYFTPFLFILLALPMKKQKMYSIIVNSLFLFLFLFVIISAKSNPMVVPSRILPVNSLFD